MLMTMDDLLHGWLTCENASHWGKPVFLEEEAEQVYLPHPDYQLIISTTDRLTAAAMLAELAGSGWRVEWHSPWDFTGDGDTEHGEA